MNAQEIRDTLRTLKRPTVIERLKENLPIPEGSVPKNGLPLWEKIPLDSKLPVIEHPKGAFVLYRDKIGKKLWRQSPTNAFRLDDPFCLDVSYDYDPLHDVNLAHIYRSPHRRQVLRRQGLISKRNEAVCSLYQFNNYRRYLQCIYRDTLKLEYEQMVENQTDLIAINKAQECAEKAMQIAKIREQRVAESLEFRRYLEQQEAQKIARIRTRQKYFDERIKKINHQKTVARKRRVAQSHVYDAGVRYRKAVADEIRRAKVAAVREMWRLAEGERTKRQKDQHANLKALKEKEISDRWQEKREFQEQRMERDSKLLEQAEEERRLATELRARKMEAEHLRMQVLFYKVKADLSKERKEARKKNEFKYIYRNECPDESLDIRRLSSTGISSRRTTASTTPHRKPQPISQCDEEFRPEYHRKIVMCIEAMEDARTNKPRPFDIWSIVRCGKRQGCHDKKAGTDTNNDKGENIENGCEEGDNEETIVQVATVVDALLTNVVQGYVHHRVMHSLKEIYHEALDKCRWLVEREERRQAERYGWVCYHLDQRQDRTRSGSIKKMGYNPCCALCCPRFPRKKAQFNPEKTMRKIEAFKRRADRYRAILEEGVECASDSDDEDEFHDDEEETDGGRLDKNFEEFSINMRRRLILLAAQSVNERFKKFTAHRWKILKEVELAELMERLCNMMMLYDSKEFLPSAEFQWAADILARDVMKEVRSQIRSERREAAIQRREEHVRGTRKIFRHRQHVPKPIVSVLQTEETPATAYDEPKILRPEDVPLLRLHSRSPHQPSLPSIIAEEF